MSEEIQGCCGYDGILGILKSLAADAEEVTVVVKSGGSCGGGHGSCSHTVEDAEIESRRRREFCCCKHRGILCNVTKSYIVLIGDRKKTFIPINAIAAIIDKDCC